jgi:acetyl-CoA C-acetyltransferase
MPGSVIISSARTPIGKLSGALASFSAMDLGGFAVAAALERAGVGPEQVDYVILGQVLQGGQGQITARQAAVKAGVPMTVPALTVNKVCLSGMNSIYLADQMIQSGDAEVVVAGGMESMTAAPYLLPGARAGYRMGEQARRLDDRRRPVVRSTPCTWAPARKARRNFGGLTREAQDDARPRATSGRPRSRKAASRPRSPVSVPSKGGRSSSTPTRASPTTQVAGQAEAGVRKDGTITAGNASQISDGAAVIVTSRAPRSWAPHRSRLRAGMVAAPTVTTHTAVACDQAGARAVDKSVTDIDLFEISEACAVGLAAMQDATSRRRRERQRRRSPSVTRSACRAPGSSSRS